MFNKNFFHIHYTLELEKLQHLIDIARHLEIREGDDTLEEKF